MLQNKITINSTEYSANSISTNQTIRQNAARPAAEPEILTVAHDVTNKGAVMSVMKINDIKLVGTDQPIASSVNSLVKVSYNPNQGRDDIKASIKAQLAGLISWFGVPENVDAFLNREH